MDEQDIERRQDEAVRMHYLEPNGNCAQCVGCALSDVAGVSSDEAFRAMEGFGGGMGSMTQVCGALSGAVYVVGRASSAGVEARTSKAQTYGTVAALVEQFEAEFGSTQCRDLRDPDPARAKKICDGYIRHAVMLAAKALEG